jgi:SlyX protein
MALESRLTDLEIRLTHQEAAIDGLTRTNLEQQKLIEQLQHEVERLRSFVQELSSGPAGPAGDEPPPPHY